MDNSREFINAVEIIVRTFLENEGLLKGNWRLGKVKDTISQGLLEVYVDGSTTFQQIPCDPDKSFNTGDEVFVVLVNGDSKNKFVLCKRNV